MLKISKWFFFLAALLSAVVRAEIKLPIAPDDPFRVYSIADGLTQNSVTAITQDADGFLWVGTFGGLNRFDGRNFKSFTTQQGLRQNLIQTLFVDRQNRLWIGDIAGGLTLMKDGRVVRTYEPPGSLHGDIRALAEFGDTLLVGSQVGGLSTLSMRDRDAEFRTVVDSPPQVTKIITRENGDILIIAIGGLFLYEPQAESPFRLIEADVTSMTPASNGKIAIGDKTGRVGWVDGRQVAWLDVNYGGSILDVVVRDDAIQWISVEGDSLYPFGVNDAKPTLSGGVVTQVTTYDAEGVLWVPTRTGLARYLGPRFRHYPLEQESAFPEVFAALPGSQEDFWFGTSIGLLHLNSEGTLRNISDQLGIRRTEVREIKFSIDKKTLWLTHTSAPIYAIDIPSMQIVKELGEETSVTMGMERDNNDRLWFGSYTGILSMYDPATDSSRDYKVADGASIYSLDMADDQYLWFSANNNGLFRIDVDDPDAQPELVVGEEDLGKGFYTHVVAQGSGALTTVWMSGIQGGVFRYKNGSVDEVINDPSIANYTIYSLRPLTDNTVVLATNKGVFRYDMDSKALEQYTALDGFTAIEGKVHANYYDGGESLLIGTTGGVSLMNLAIPMYGVGVPKPLITQFLVDGESVIDKRAHLKDFAFRSLVIGFTAVSTRYPEGIEFSYRLVGNNASWSAPGEAMSISYSQLQPGEHRFELRARLRGGQWSVPAQWAFTVPTPFWRTTWFAILSVVTAMLLAWMLIQLRLRSIANVNRRLREEVATRTKSIEAGRRELERANEQLSSEIQERKRADAMREEVEIRFHQAYQNSPMGMALVDSDGLVYSANPKMKQLFWPDAPEDSKEPLIQVIAESDRDRFSQFLSEFSLDKTDASSMEANCVASDGQELIIDFRPAAIRDSAGDFKHIVLLAHDVTESRAMTDKLEYQASFDELTGLINRRAFAMRLEEVEGTLGADEKAFLMFLDLDQFKIVNDTCGHAAGDELLRKTARLLVDCVRDNDIVSRLGGDEFAIILTHCTQDVAMQRAEQVRQNIENLEFLWDQDVFRIGVSIGVVPMAQASRDLNELQQVADAACYAAKDAGRNRVHLVSGTEDTVHERRGEMRWVQRLNQAIDQDGFVLFGQRITALTPDPEPQERIEVLLRMPEPNSDRLIPPGAFLPAAERYGLQGRLDLWVVNKVIQILHEQRITESTGQRVWVNLSGATIGDTRISREFVELIENAKLPPGSLNFEITETAVIRNIDDATAMITQLQSRGCRFALDDFGSGLSSFGYLRKLNVDYLKIDGQFVRDIATDESDRTFVRSIIDIAHSLQMRVVAEFVENEETLSLIRELGSDYAQGFHMHRPEPLVSLLPGFDAGAQSNARKQ